MKKVSIAVVDDSSLMIQAIEDKLSFFPEIQIGEVFQSGPDFIECLAQGKRFDLVLMDIEMPHMSGVEVTRLVKSKYPQIKVVMLTVVDSDGDILRSIQAGADGYLLKDVGPKELSDGILQTLEGGAAMTPSIARKSLQLLRNVQVVNDVIEPLDVELTARESDVLLQISKGLEYKAIADNLFISPSTVRKHIENIYKKLQVHSKLEAIELAKRNNLI